MVEDGAALEHEDAVGERQHEVEIVLDDDDGGVAAQPVEHAEQLEHHRGREALEGLDTLARLPVKQFGQTLHNLGVGLSKIVPNLQVYVPARPLLTGEVEGQPLLPYIGMAAVAGIAWSVGLLAAASLIFKKRDFL